MPNIFIISDTHFDHEGILRFTGYDGQPLRQFDDVNHMNEHMVDRWNSVVRPQDKVYHLGDVGKTDTSLKYIARCNGHKRLVLGNHDFKKVRIYLPYFEDIYGSRLVDKLLLTHIPVHPLSLGKAIANVHGHVHNNVGPDHFGEPYVNVSVEVIDYTPVAWEDLKRLVAKRLKQ
jgi:calcineurin-like phosphoesterase family protein